MTKQIHTAPRDWTPSRYKTKKNNRDLFPKRVSTKIYVYKFIYIISYVITLKASVKMRARTEALQIYHATALSRV